MGMEMPSFEQVPEGKKVEPKDEKNSGLSKLTEKIKTGIALGTAIAGIGMSEMNEAQGADRPAPTRTAERVTHSGRQDLNKTVQTPLGEIRYTNPLDALTADVGYRPKVIRHTTSFGASVGGVNNKVRVHLETRHSDRVVSPGSQSRKIRHR